MAPRDLAKGREVLRQAMHRYGSRQHLAEGLGVTDAQLSRWLSGAELPPDDVVLLAIELAAGRPRR